MTYRPEMIAELTESIEALYDGELAPEQAQYLKELLEANPDARRQYVRLTAFFVSLQSCCATLPADTWEEDDPCGSPASPIILHPSPAIPYPLSTIHSLLFSYLTAALIMGVGMLIAAMWKLPDYSQVARNAPTGPSRRMGSVPFSGKPQMEFVGRITGMVDCKWDEGSAVTGQGPETGTQNSEIRNQKVLVPLGGKYSLRSGLMEITYDTGAKVILQGPVTYEVESRSGGYLSVGKLTARLDKGSEIRDKRSEILHPSSFIPHPLFSVRTPAATVTDLGTEFGVEVLPGRVTEVHVFRGSVATEFVVGLAASVRRMNVSEGNAVRFDGQKASLVRLAAKPSVFLRTIPCGVRELAARCPVIYCSGVWTEKGKEDWSTFLYLVGPWHVTDGKIDDEQLTAWLGREQTPDEYFILSLCGRFEIERMELLNTHNRRFNDRGTKDFAIWAADKVSEQPDGRRELVEPRLVLRGTLPCRFGTGSKTPFDVFSESQHDFTRFSARYIKFVAKTYYGSGCGLNEIRVFGIPDNQVTP